MTIFNHALKEQKYGMRGGKMHKGVDYGVLGRRNVHIGCPLNGFKVRAIKQNFGRKSGYGNHIELISLDGTKMLRIAHMRYKPTHLKVGQELKRGDFIGIVGGTGRLSRPYAPHIHFEVYLKNNKGNFYTVNPHNNTYRNFSKEDFESVIKLAETERKRIQAGQKKGTTRLATVTKTGTQKVKQTEPVKKETKPNANYGRPVLATNKKNTQNKAEIPFVLNNQTKKNEGEAIHNRYIYVPEKEEAALYGSYENYYAAMEKGTDPLPRLSNAEFKAIGAILKNKSVPMDNSDLSNQLTTEQKRAIVGVLKDKNVPIAREIETQARTSTALAVTLPKKNNENEKKVIPIETPVTKKKPERIAARQTIKAKNTPVAQVPVTQKTPAQTTMPIASQTQKAHWFKDSFLGRLFGLDQETQRIRDRNAKLLAEKGLEPGGYFANTWIGKLFRADDFSRLADYEGRMRIAAFKKRQEELKRTPVRTPIVTTAVQQPIQNALTQAGTRITPHQTLDEL